MGSCKALYSTSTVSLCNKTVVLLPSETKLAQGYVLTRVCDSAHRGVVSDNPSPGRHSLEDIPLCSACWVPLPGRHPPGSRHTKEQAFLQSRHPRSSQPPLGADTPHQEQNPPGADTPQGADTPGRHLTWADTPLWAVAPPAQCMLGDMVNELAVRILLECILVSILVLDLVRLDELD